MRQRGRLPSRCVRQICQLRWTQPRSFCIITTGWCWCQPTARTEPTTPVDARQFLVASVVPGGHSAPGHSNRRRDQTLSPAPLARPGTHQRKRLDGAGTRDRPRYPLGAGWGLPRHNNVTVGQTGPLLAGRCRQTSRDAGRPCLCAVDAVVAGSQRLQRAASFGSIQEACFSIDRPPSRGRGHNLSGASWALGNVGSRAASAGRRRHPTPEKKRPGCPTVWPLSLDFGDQSHLGFHNDGLRRTALSHPHPLRIGLACRAVFITCGHGARQSTKTRPDRTAAAAMALSGADEAKAPRQSVAIVGTGLAGLTTAYLLHNDDRRRYDVTLLEQASRFPAPPRARPQTLTAQAAGRRAVV